MKQRQLTQEEIDKAHSLGWGPTDFIIMDGSVIFENKRNYQVLYPDGELSPLMNRPSDNAVKAQPIPRKAFDISEYEFSDNRICSETSKTDGRVWLIVKCSFGEIPASFNKTDSIAIAKALGVTAEDFK